MQIEITSPIPDKNPRNAYILDVEVMHGDADMYTIRHIKFGDGPAEMGRLEEILTIIEAMKEFDPEDYHKVPGYEEFIEPHWSGDKIYIDDPARYEGHELRFFDANGVEHQTKVTL
jgi:hypothetical protein